jgi:hypothetical protein
MFYHVIMHVWSFVLDLVSISQLASDEKDLEILLLRQQLRIVERKQQRGPHIPRWEKVPLAVLSQRLKKQACGGYLRYPSRFSGESARTVQKPNARG